MTARKPLDEECTGSVLCEVEGHVTARRYNGTTFSHIPLTQGQRKTLRERRTAERTKEA